MGILGYEPVESQIAECGDGAPAARPSRDAVEVASVEPGSVAERAGLLAGDRILSINGEAVRDAIDLAFHSSEYELDLRVEREGRPKPFRLTIEREPGEEFGVVPRDFRIRQCNNQCVFCFIHQNPPGLRKGIYFKDGDFRMSFLHGNYITTTNMKDEDFDRIVEQKLSPMYVSVHATNHELRLRMLGVKKSNDVLESLRRFKRGGIDFHTQIVLCPGWNDGDELDRTIRELAPLAPRLLSIAVVPLGLTDHREDLPRMEPVTPTFCKETIARVKPWQDRFAMKHGEPLVYLADEFYITAGRKAPTYRDAEAIHQLENGVGMVWQFMLPWRRAQKKLPMGLPRPRSVAILTGLLGARIMRPLTERFAKVRNLRVDAIPVTNTLFGASVTVSGLLPGRDFQRAIRENPGYDLYLIPGNAVRHEGGVFLDDVRLEDIEARSRGGKIRAVEGDCADLVDAVLGASEPLGSPLSGGGAFADHGGTGGNGDRR